MPAQLKVYWHCRSYWSNHLPTAFPARYSRTFEICLTSPFLEALPEIGGMDSPNCNAFTKHKWGHGANPCQLGRFISNEYCRAYIAEWEVISIPNLEKGYSYGKPPNRDENLYFKFRSSGQRMRSQKERQAVSYLLLGKSRMPKDTSQVCFSNTCYTVQTV